MKRKPSTNPQIDGKSMSFVCLESSVAGPLGYRQAKFTDSRNVPYTRDVKGTVRRIRAEDSKNFLNI